MTNAELAILGLVLERPRHGYEIDETIEERGMRDWTEVGFSSIYYILNKLEARGLITSHKEAAPGRGPARKVYSITDAGQAAWYQATIQALSDPGVPSHSFLLGLAGLPALPTGETVAALRTYMAQLEERHAGIEARWLGSRAEMPLFLDGMFEYSYRLVQTEIEWLEEFIGKLEAQKGKTA